MASGRIPARDTPAPTWRRGAWTAALRSAPRIIETWAKAGDRVAERLVAEDLLRRVRQVVVAADDVADAHGDVVDDHAEVVGRGAVGAHEDPVVELPVVEGHRAVDEVVDHRGAVVRDAQAQRARDEPPVAAAPRVPEGLAARLGRLAARGRARSGEQSQ